MILHTVTSSAVTRALERQSPSGTGSCRSQERHAGASVRSIESSSVAISRTRRVMLSLIVDESDWARARIAIMRSGRSDVEILRVAPIARTSNLRVHIGLESAALDETMSRIMRSLKEAEFGPVTPIPRRAASISPAVAKS